MFKIYKSYLMFPTAGSNVPSLSEITTAAKLVRLRRCVDDQPEPSRPYHSPRFLIEALTPLPSSRDDFVHGKELLRRIS